MELKLTKFEDIFHIKNNFQNMNPINYTSYNLKIIRHLKVKNNGVMNHCDQKLKCVIKTSVFNALS